MQALYAIDWSEGSGKTIKYLDKNFELSRKLYAYLIYFITEIARYVEKDARRKAGKHLPTESDLNINTKLAGNEVLWQILESASFKAAIQEINANNLMDEEVLKKLYQSLLVTEEYKEYIEDKSRNRKDERKILEFIFNSIMLSNENFIQHIEENFVNWDDDAEMMQTLVMNYLSKLQPNGFSEIISGEKLLFARELVKTVIEKHEHTMSLIKPKLKNWDAERIAALDMILLEMGVNEFLYFETIPTKVTINEYIDIAKAYSTPQSGQFVNGILDNIHKELLETNQIEKINFKKPV